MTEGINFNWAFDGTGLRADIPHPLVGERTVTIKLSIDEVGHLFTVESVGWGGYGTPVYTRSGASAVHVGNQLVKLLLDEVQPEF